MLMQIYEFTKYEQPTVQFWFVKFTHKKVNLCKINNYKLHTNRWHDPVKPM